MKKYKIEVTETLQRVVDIEANDYDEALTKIREQYRQEKIVLDWEDFVDVKIDIFKN